MLDFRNRIFASSLRHQRTVGAQARVPLPLIGAILDIVNGAERDSRKVVSAEVGRVNVAIKQVRIRNFKRLRSLDRDFEDGMNILVGDNDAGKSTILEAIHLAATGILGGRYLRNELSQHLFNNESVAEYIASVKAGAARTLPEILIEIFLADGTFPELEGNGNSTGDKATGFYLKVHFDDTFQAEYSNLIRVGTPLLTLPFQKS